MRYERLVIPPQCCALGDCRMALGGRGRASLWSLTTSQARYYRTNSLYKAGPRTAIHRDSLQKTLEAHRVANRAKVIRKVYLNEPDPRIYRPLILQPDAEPNTTNQPSTAQEPEISEKPLLTKQLDGRQEKPSKPSKRASLGVRGGRVAQCPWLGLSKSGRAETGESRLSTEISALAEYLRPSHPEESIVSRIVGKIAEHVAAAVPNASELVGSRSTQIAISSSDINLMILVDPPTGDRASSSMNPKTTKTFTSIIEKLHAEIRRNSVFDDLAIVEGKSPILSMTHQASGLPIKIFCGYNLPHSDAYITASLSTLPSLLPLYVVLRALLESRNLFGWEKASLDSYGLILIISAFLKQKSPEWQKRGLGEQLLALLDTYSSQVNLETVGVAVEPASFFTLSSVRRAEKENQLSELHPVLIGQRALLRFKVHAASKANYLAAKHLCIQDPTNHLHDAGLQCVRTAELQGILADAHRDLTFAVGKWDQSDTSILGQALHANFDDLERIRTAMTVL
ncbi:hypothetical protein BGW36DRAFT_392270 [Talaromyces proteolyticus]|uniref:Poly(A) RNA polymerase mitochondrial-like central palm domain-containing protein n=1 Tax=Talaromyces proteolyticus TaxID=1131652 RepID=A0AAD4PU32_9EURO|nr:uncharacterized protein BGW36DRAFT_392270 [Talaromyces proteolyticus]KAH8688849.1 hypothetical protein BGW36DRAFT_392270 [Talaromyces proteolyticus]